MGIFMGSYLIADAVGYIDGTERTFQYTMVADIFTAQVGSAMATGFGISALRAATKGNHQDFEEGTEQNGMIRSTLGPVERA